MKKLFRTILTFVAAGILTGALVAQTDVRLHNSGSSSAEMLAGKPVRGYQAPRAKQGQGTSLYHPTFGSTGFNVKTNSSDIFKEYIEYVPELMGMNWTAMSTTLQNISPDGTLTPVPTASLSAGMGTPSGGCGYGENYYVTIKYTYPNGMQIYYGFTYDTETWNMVGNPSSLSQRFMSTDLTIDPTDGTIYGCFSNDAATGYEFGTVNFTEGERTTIGSGLPGAWNAIASDKEGNLYAIDMEGNLLKVNKSTGETTSIGATGFVPQNVSSATFDHKTGKLYWTVSTDAAGFLCEVDTTTGAATKIADFDNADEIYALYVKAPAAEDEAPAIPTNLTLNFVNDSLSGTLSFDAPETLFRGQEATGNVDYRVMLGAEVLATGTTEYGKKNVVSPTFSVEAPGRYTFTLICSNAAGDSPKTEISKFIGEDAPAAVTNAVAEYADGKFNVSWTAPANSANGGYINPDEVKYDVTRNPDAVQVASGISTTSITDNVAEPESFVKYSYTITASYNGLSSYPVKTNGVGLGNIVPPYTDDFSDTGFLETYSVIDTDGDGRGFAPFIGMAQSLGALYGAEDKHVDQWLVTPAVKLEGGKFYKFGIDAATMGSAWTEKFEVKLGNAIYVDSFTTQIIAPSEVTTASYMMPTHFEEYFTVPEDGIYYIAIHHLTDDSYMLLLDNLSISAAIEGAAPAAVENLVIEPAEGGEKKVTISFTAPATDLSGEALEFLDRIEIKLNDNPFHTITDLTPGQEVSIELDVPTSGDHKFTVTPWNGTTEGRESEIELHVGKNVPVAPANLQANYGEQPGSVVITWEAVTKDIHGLTLGSDEVSYTIVRLNNGQQELVANGLTGTDFTYTPQVEAGSQEFFQYSVFALAEAGFSSGNVTQMLAIGTPDGMPWIESFADGFVEHIFAAHALADTQGAWMAFGDQSFSNGVKSYDADNGLMGMYGASIGDKARLFTGKIDFTGLEHPTLTFYTFNLRASDHGTVDTNEITIQADNGNGYVPVTTLVVDEVASGVRGWAKAVVDLSDYAGQTIQLAFDAETKSYLYTLIDLVQIADRKNNDLSIAISAPVVSDLGEEFNVVATVENAGRNNAEGYKVTLYSNDTAVAELDGETLASGQTANYTFKHALNASDEEMNTLAVTVSYASDENMTNNTAESKVRVRHTDFPQVRELSATRVDDNNVQLKWTEPEAFAVDAAPVTEDFESAETEDTFPTEFGSWTLLDEDKGYIGGLRGVELPGIQTGSQQGFWVMDADHPVFGGNRSYQAHSGSKYLAQMYTMDATASGPVACDDWIISPLLNEKEQTVEFYARSYGGEDTAERFQFLYSTTGTEPADFTHLSTVPAVPKEWTKYEFNIPLGAKHFAIRCTSIFEFMLFIDDITYNKADGSNVILQGYNVYVDGVKANDDLIKDCEYRVATPKANDETTRYSVSALYSRGESKAVHTYTGTLGIDDLEASNSVTTEKGHIIINGEITNVTVTATDGTVRFRGTAGQGQSIPVANGVYVVNLNGKTVKVLVK